MPQEAEMSPPIRAKSCPNCRFMIIINDCHCLRLPVLERCVVQQYGTGVLGKMESHGGL